MHDFDRLKYIFEKRIQVTSISEPILWQSYEMHDEPLISFAVENRFDTVLLNDSERNPHSYIQKEGGKWTRQFFKHDELVSDSTPLSEILDILIDKKRLFIIQRNYISQIVSIADLEKMPIRIWLFGIISLFEVLFKNHINNNYQEEHWIDAIGEKQLEEALKLFNIQKSNNIELNLIDSFYLKELLKICMHLKIHETNLFIDSRIFKSNWFKIQALRNIIAHSKNIEQNFGWEKVLPVYRFAKEMMNRIEQISIDKVTTAILPKS